MLAGLGINSDPDNNAVLDQPDSILVGTGSNRVFRAEVAISRHSGQTVIDVRPGGLPGSWPGGLKLINRVLTARGAYQVLEAPPAFGEGSQWAARVSIPAPWD